MYPGYKFSLDNNKLVSSDYYFEKINDEQFFLYTILAITILFISSNLLSIVVSKKSLHLGQEIGIQLNNKINTFQFIYIGRLIFYKNIEIILKAFKIVTKEFPNVKLIIAGGGPHKQSLQELTKKLDIY